MSVAGRHPRKTVQTRPPNQVDEHRFHIVVVVMCHADAGHIKVASQTFEVGIAQFSCCHLDAHFVQ